MPDDNEFAELVARHPELAGLARMVENSPTEMRQEAINAFVQLARVYETRTVEQRRELFEYAARHVREWATKAQH